MAQVQQIYARLFTHTDVATSLLLKQDLVDTEFVRERGCFGAVNFGSQIAATVNFGN
jgi:hypothetical protein